MTKNETKFTGEDKAKADTDYVEGVRTAKKIAKDIDVEIQLIYQ
jgi:hypothetical protein